MVLTIRDLLGEEPALLMAKQEASAITTTNGVRCSVDGHPLRVPTSGRSREAVCQGCARRVAVTPDQVKAIRDLDRRSVAEQRERAARLAAVPRYPVCGCGGPLMLPEQAGKASIRGRLFCGSCGPTTGATQKATEEQIDKARAAAKAEGFEVKT